MAFEREIVRYLQNVDACRALAASLAAREGLDASDDAKDFLDKVAVRSDDAPLTRRQTEFLLSIRDDNRYVSSLYDFDLVAVLKNCWLARADLDDEGDVAFLARLKERGGKSFKVAEGRRLLRVARKIDGVVD
jgi:hypothetical protein